MTAPIRETWMGDWTDEDLATIQRFQDQTGADWPSAVRWFRQGR